MASSTFWDDHVFVLVSPDALMRGLAPAMGDRLRKEGFTPVSARVVQVDGEMIDDLYAEVIAGSWQTWRYRLVDSAFAIGPALALICRYAGGQGDPHQLLRARKGTSDPHTSPDGSIRNDFGAINSVLGVMHASDNPAESAKDAQVFGLSEMDPLCTEQQINFIAALTVPALPEVRGYLGVIAGVRARVLLSLIPDLPAPTVLELHESFEDRRALSAADASTRLDGLLSGVVPPTILRALTCEFTPQWREQNHGFRVLDVIRRHGIRLDDWETLMLETSLYFPSVRQFECRSI